jgi:hypothetical protein
MAAQPKLVIRNGRPATVRRAEALFVQLERELVEAVTSYHINRRLYSLAGEPAR